MQEMMSFESLNHPKPLRIIPYIYLVADLNLLTDVKRFAGHHVFVATNQFTTAWSLKIFLTLW